MEANTKTLYLHKVKNNRYVNFALSHQRSSAINITTNYLRENWGVFMVEV